MFNQNVETLTLLKVKMIITNLALHYTGRRVFEKTFPEMTITVVSNDGTNQPELL